MQNYFYHDGNQQKGPVNLKELKSLPLTKETLIWQEGMSEWKKAGEVLDFNDYFKTIPPPISASKPLESDVKPPVMHAVSDSSANRSGSGKLKMGLGIAIIAVAAVSFLGYIQTTKEDLVDEAVKEQQVQANERKAEEERIKMEALELEKKTIRNRITDYIGYNTTYNAEVFGGINNVMVKVSNNTEYPIDEVVIRVKYIKDNGGLWTTYDVRVRNIAAKGTSIERADDSNRGTKLECEILSIKSEGLNLCFEGVQGGEDPYRCR